LILQSFFIIFIPAHGLGGAKQMLAINELLRCQRDQYNHDRRNHTDILNLPKTDRLKHYGLHFAKYVGRLARRADESKSVDRTVVDTFLVCLSAANTLHQELCAIDLGTVTPQIEPLYVLADAAGRFADACEKIDHMEEFISIARRANADVMTWVMSIASKRQINLELAARLRRDELAARQFFITD
jgi:hypothetical protein